MPHSSVPPTLPRLALALGILLLALGAAAPAPVASPPGMTIGQAAVLGLVEGLTEYLPVSSTGHLILTQRAMGIGGDNGGKEAADAYAICIQLGAILAVLGLYAPQIFRMINGLVGRDPDGRRLLINLALAFLPAAVAGLTVFELVKQYLFGLWPVVGAWFVGGVAILAVDRWRRGRDSTRGFDLFELSARGALLIGLFQCLAMWPGVSRSLVTIVGAIVAGLSLEAAVTFSFLLGAMTLGAGTLHDGIKHGELLLTTYGAPSLLTGFVVAFFSAVVAVRWMVAYLKRHGLALFGYYRIGIAIVTAVCILAGWLRP